MDVFLMARTKLVSQLTNAIYAKKNKQNFEKCENAKTK